MLQGAAVQTFVIDSFAGRRRNCGESLKEQGIQAC